MTFAAAQRPTPLVMERSSSPTKTPKRPSGGANGRHYPRSQWSQSYDNALWKPTEPEIETRPSFSERHGSASHFQGSPAWRAKPSSGGSVSTAPPTPPFTDPPSKLWPLHSANSPVTTNSARERASPPGPRLTSPASFAATPSRSRDSGDGRDFPWGFVSD